MLQTCPVGQPGLHGTAHVPTATTVESATHVWMTPAVHGASWLQVKPAGHGSGPEPDPEPGPIQGAVHWPLLSHSPEVQSELEPHAAPSGANTRLAEHVVSLGQSVGSLPVAHSA